MAVRKVQNRGSNIVGRFPSLKMGRLVAFESKIERDYLFLLDYEPGVTYFTEQPLTIEYRVNGKPYQYTPDFHVIQDGQHLLVECKPDRYKNSQRNQRKFAAGQAWCAERGWTFVVKTDLEIRAGYRLQNIKLLTRYARHTVEPSVRTSILQRLARAGAALPVTAFFPIGSRASITCAILHLAFYGEVCIPLDDAEFSAATLVSLPQENIP